MLTRSNKEISFMKFFVCGLLFGIALYDVFGRALPGDDWKALEAQRAQGEYIRSIENRAIAEKTAFEKRTKEIIETYNSNVKDLLETEELDQELSLKENIAKLQLKVIRVKNLNEAKVQAKKRALNDKNYVNKQISNSNMLSLYEINETVPFYSKDGTVETTKIMHYDSVGANGAIKYTYEEIIKKYPDIGLSSERYYKYITLSKNKKEMSEDSSFEKGGIIFVDESINLEETKPADIFIVSISAPVSEETMIEAVKKYNNSLKSNKKSKGTLSNKKAATPASKPATSKNNTTKQTK